MIVFGINTGTSADAVDCVACDYSDGKQTFVDAVSLEMPSSLQAEIVRAVENASLTIEESVKLSSQLTAMYIEVAGLLLQKLAITSSQVAAIGLHGQTIHHRPQHDYPYTLQLGDAEVLASRLGIDVIDRFRHSDISLGGQGAPLIPAYHNYLARTAGHESVLFMNLGGIANITECGTKAHLRGWDIGPANALMDLWCQEHLKQPYDDQGRWARTGQCIPNLLNQWLQDSYFSRELPKSTGRDYFSSAWFERTDGIRQYAAEDVQATLCALTVHAIEHDIKRFVNKSKGVMYVYGKGVYNTFLLEQLGERLPGFSIKTTSAIGIDAEWLEGGLFAWLAYSYKVQEPCDLTGVTGARRPAVLGACCVGS